MIHAWGTTPSVGWNFPSWSISAEWAAYLLFPLVAALVLKAKRPAAMVASALALCLISFAGLSNLHQVLPWVGRDFSQMTAQIGALRILPSFLLGVSLYAFGRTYAAPAWAAWPIALASAAWVLIVCTFNLWEGLVWFGLAGLLYGLAETARHQLDAPMAGERFVFLGAASYALYMIHLPIDIVWFHALEKFGVTESSDLFVRIGAVAGVFAVSIIASMFAHSWLEEPARNWIRKLDFSRAPARRLSTAR
jgi:peptidoglycan/LPS O-acetylase OafA/YrhL